MNIHKNMSNTTQGKSFIVTHLESIWIDLFLRLYETIYANK
jgi:hypothetical protein